jgi:hypothetical protein
MMEEGCQNGAAGTVYSFPTTRNTKEKKHCFVSKYFISSFRFIGPRQLSRYSASPRGGRSGNRIPVGGGARFSAPVQTGLGHTLAPIQWVPGLSRG